MNNSDNILDNPIFLGMDPLKLQFIKSFVQKEKPTDLKAAMPFLIANMNLAKKQNINFNMDEVQLISQILCKNLPADEQKKVQRVIAMMNSAQK